MHDEMSLVKQLAMRRTVFVFPRDLLAAVWPSASARVARTERAQMVRDVVAAGIADDGGAARRDHLDRPHRGRLGRLVKRHRAVMPHHQLHPEPDRSAP